MCPAIFGGPPQHQKQLGHHTVCALLRHEASEVGNTPKSNQGWIPPWILPWTSWNIPPMLRFQVGYSLTSPLRTSPKIVGTWSQESLCCHWAASWNLGPCNKRPWWSRTAKSPGLGYDKLNFMRSDITNPDFLKALKSSNSSLERRCAFEGLLVWFPPLKDRPVRMIFVSWTHTPSPEKWGLVMTSWRLLMGTIWLLTLYRTSTSGQWWG